MLHPLGEAAVKILENAVGGLEHAWEAHTTQIKGFILATGNTLIHLGHTVEEFAELSLRILAPVAEAFKDIGLAILDVVGQMQPLGKLLEHVPGMQGLGKAMEDAGTDALNMGQAMGKLDVSANMNRVADWIHQHTLNVDSATDSWKRLFNEVSGDAANIPGVSQAAPGGIPGAAVPWGAVPGATSLAPSGAGPVVPPQLGPGSAPNQSPMMPGAHHANWQAIAGAESSGNWQITYGEGPDVTGGLQIATATWLSHGGGAYAPKAYQATPEQQISVAEKILADPSQGPKAWPTTYRNHPDWFATASKGLHVTGGSGMRDDVPILAKRGEYVWSTEAVDKYGPMIDYFNRTAVQGFSGGGSVGGVLQVIWDNPRSGSQVGEAGGQLVGPGTSQPGYYRDDWKDHTGHVHTSFATGPNGEFYGLPKGTDIRPGAAGFPDWVYSLGSEYGLQPSTYPGHQESSGYNRGIDWWPAGAQDMSGQSYTPAMIGKLQSFAENVAMIG